MEINTDHIKFFGKQKAGPKEIELIKIVTEVFSGGQSTAAAAGIVPALIANYCYEPFHGEYKNQFLS